MPPPAAPTDRDQLIVAIYVDPLDGRRYTEDRDLEWDGQMHTDHRVEARSLLGLTIRIDDRVVDQLIELCG